MENGCLGCLGISTVTSWPLDGDLPPPLAGNPRNPAMTPAPHRVFQAIVKLILWWKIKGWEGA